MTAFLMQAVSSTDGQLKTWITGTPDWSAASFPGPGSALNTALAATYDNAFVSPDGRYAFSSLAPSSREGSASLASGSTQHVAIQVANNTIWRTTWLARVRVGGVNYVIDFHTITQVDGAGVITRLASRLLGDPPPAGVTINWTTTGATFRLSVANSTGAAIEVWVAHSSVIETTS